MKKPSYAKVVTDIVRESGMASRAYIGKQAKLRGCEKSKLLANALKKALENKTIEFSAKSYVLGQKTRDALDSAAAKQYTERLQEKMDARDEAADKKAAGRERAEERYRANIIAAMTEPASAWNRGVAD